MIEVLKRKFQKELCPNSLLMQPKIRDIKKEFE
jgi:hypothetical protein